MTNKPSEILKTFSSLKERRNELEQYWRDAYRYTKPHRGQKFLSRSNDNYHNAQNDLSAIYDSTAIDTVNLLASSIVSALTPSASQWFIFSIPGVDVEDLDFESKDWLQDSSTRLWNLIHASNYNATVLEFFEDISISGMDGLFIDKKPGGSFVFEVWSHEDLYVSETLGNGVIDTVYRSLMLTAEQAVNKFSKPHANHVREAKDYCSKKHQFVHCIRPRMKNGKQVYGKLSKSMPWESVYVDIENNVVVEESGFNEFPVVIPRWSLIPGTPYALGPLNDALPTVKTLNRVREMMLENAEMAIAGTYVAKQDGILNPNTVRIGSRKIIFVADPQNIRPLTAAGDFRIGYEEVRSMQEQIRMIMMADQLSPIQKNFVSATEVSTRANIVRAILGPRFSRINSEFTDRLLDRCFRLAYRDGEFGDAPDAIANVGFIPVYTNPISKAQKTEEVASIERYIMSIAQTAQSFPQALDVVDGDKLSRILAEYNGVPYDILRSPEQVQILREKQAQLQQQQAEQAAMQKDMVANG